MDVFNKNPRNRYERVMPRVSNQSRSTLKATSFVTRHDIPTSVRVGAKQSVSNVSSSVFNELPTVLNDFIPESSSKKVSRTFVVKPRKTIKSLDPAKSPTVAKSKQFGKRPLNVRTPDSAPSVLRAAGEQWSETHYKQCLTSRSHSRLKELKSEIRAYHETDKLMRIRSNLFKKCGVVLDDVGKIAADKAVQVEELTPVAHDLPPADIRKKRCAVGEDAGTSMSDQQMRSITSVYPVDRYMVESSRKYEMVNIIDDDLWNTEPALKPEDELILRKLHEMLQSTADDLKLLSGELSKFHKSGVQFKTAPTPLDEEFNEKVHIEEIVNAKFHGYKVIDKPSNLPECNMGKHITNNVKPKESNKNNANIQLNTAPILKKPIIKNLGVTRTKVIQIDGNQDSTKTEKLNNGRVVNAPVAYNEYSFQYEEPNLSTPRQVLQVQKMPSINIRSELKEQKVLHLDIIPDAKESEKSNMITKNVAVVAVQHEIPPQVITTIVTESHKPIERQPTTNRVVRKVSKMAPCDSSGSTNVSTDTQIKLNTQRRLLTNIKPSKYSARSDHQKDNSKRESGKRPHANIKEWRKKLNVVYGSSTTKNNKATTLKSKSKISPKNNNIPPRTLTKSGALNNAEYIPYSKLTIGGARASDIEREISEMPNKGNIPLSPILDRILSSRENSFGKTSPNKQKMNNKLDVFTTSDENLLQEVIDIEKTVSETLSKNIKSTDSGPIPIPSPLLISSDSDEAKENESYVDDFEDEKSDNSGQSGNQRTYSRHSNESDEADNTEINKNNNVKDIKTGPSTSNINIHNLTHTKIPNLSFKNTIDVFEFVPSLDTHDSATQSFGTQRISPKETQTTPRSDKNVQPIHNDLWPSIDPQGQVEKMFELEKELIKKLIVEEYGDMLEKNITKPSTSKECENKTNIAASQKNTQTSPAHVKNVMTSPTRTKTRTTSPFTMATVDHHTSPLILVTNENDNRFEKGLDEDDLCISVNLSSPRFSLRLPRNSQDVFSNIEDSGPRTQKKSTFETRKTSAEARETVTEVIKIATDKRKSATEGRRTATDGRRTATDKRKAVINVKKSNLNITTTSTSSIEADSSEISSLGEVKLKRMLAKSLGCKSSSDSESVSSSFSKYSSDFQSGILPLRSEGEMSLGLVKKSNKHSKSEGETSFGML